MNSITKILTAILLTATCSTHLFAQSGTIDINSPSSGSGYTWNSPTLTIEVSGTYTSTGSGATTNRIAVGPGITANITIRDVNINVRSTSGACAFDIASGSNVVLTLEGTNTLSSGNGRAGLQKGASGSLEITAADNTHSLTASSAYGSGAGAGAGAGIGGGHNGAGSNITISGGKVTATGGTGYLASSTSYAGAGIGGGHGGAGTNITVSGGEVTANGINAYSYGGSAGIGGGLSGSGTYITVTGGTVTATGGDGGAGIGGGDGGPGTNITVSGGTVEATGKWCGAGIGGGGSNKGPGSNITISGGTVTATSTLWGAGIGGGHGGTCGNVTISGGTVIVNGGGNAATIGGGAYNVGDGNVRIYGGSVKMIGNDGPQPRTEDGTPVYLNTLTVDGLSAVTPVTAGVIGSTVCSETPSGGSYGIRDVKTDASGKVYFYLPATTAGSSETVMLGAGGAYYSDEYPRTASHTANSATLMSVPSAVAFVLEGIAQAPYDFGSLTYGYESGDLPAALTVTVRNTGNAATGDLDVTGPHFTLTPASPLASIPAGSTTTFTVQPKTDLAAGTYTDTVRVTDAGGISALFTVRFTVNRKNIAITGGTVTPKDYDGNQTATVAGLTFNDPATDEFEIGTDYTVISASYTDNSNAGNSKPVRAYVTLQNTEKAKNYSLTNWNYSSLTGEINRITPTLAKLDFTLSDVAYDGLAHSVTVMPASGVAGLGAITVYYNGSTTPPVAAGTYAVTVDIANDGINYLDATGLTLGSYKITGVPPTSADLAFDLSDVTYDGSAHPVTVTFKTGSAGFGAITAVKYNGSATPPTAAGAYTLTVDIAAGTGHAAINLTLGTFLIDKAKPTLDAIDFTLGDIACTGDPYPVPVNPAKDIEGLGEITVRYNGSVTVPVDPGEYIVTIDIAEGDNYAAVTGLPIGAFIIQEPPIPVPTHFRVLLPSAAGLTTDPPAGTYNVNGGANFTFTLTPDVPSADGTPPQVQTNRPTPDRPNASGIRITPNADGSYTVVIIGIRQDIEIDLAVADSKSGPTGSESVADGLNIYTAPGAIVVTNSRPDAATVYVYSLAGTLVRLTTVVPGTTRLAVPRGVYIVTDGGVFQRKAAVFR
jgi:hypothetical protein